VTGEMLQKKMSEVIASMPSDMSLDRAKFSSIVINVLLSANVVHEAFKQDVEFTVFIQAVDELKAGVMALTSGTSLMFLKTMFETAPVTEVTLSLDEVQLEEPITDHEYVPDPDSTPPFFCPVCGRREAEHPK
jgi:hypothetical protein